MTLSKDRLVPQIRRPCLFRNSREILIRHCLFFGSPVFFSEVVTQAGLARRILNREAILFLNSQPRMEV